MLVFVQLILLVALAASTALPAPAPISAPEFSYAQIYEKRAHLQAQPAAGLTRRELIERQSPDWGNYLYIAEQTHGMVGQNAMLISIPANRAICPVELSDLVSCADSFESPCIEERFAWEWCLQHRILISTGCGAEWIEVTLQCTGGERADCVDALDNLNVCAWGLPSLPSLPPP